MTNIPWDNEASLMRVTTFSTAEPQEELAHHGIFRELVGTFLNMDPVAQKALLLRAAGPDWTQEYDADEIRELAAHPGYAGVSGAFDTTDLSDDPEADEEADREIDGTMRENGSGDATADRLGNTGRGA